MIMERQDRFPKGTYKVLAQKQGDETLFSVINLSSGKQACCSNLWELVKLIELDMSENKYPQCCMQYRSWSQGGASGKPDWGNVVAMGGAAEAPQTGPTFIVKVLFRQNATWQGTIQWLEGRMTRQFRSSNELMWLMDEAMDLPPAQPDEPTG